MKKIILTLLLFIVFNQAMAADVGITSLRIGNHGKSVRIVFDLTEKTAYHIFSMTDPDRTVIDIDNSEIMFDKAILPKLAKNEYNLNAIRTGKIDNGYKTRIVLEYANGDSMTAKDFMLAPSSGFAWRLVIDLTKNNSKTTKTSAAVITKGTVTPKKNQAVEAGKKPLIVVDAGHGGNDPGAIGVSGVEEKTITLAAALELRRQLVNTGKYNVFLTRDSDTTLSLGSRVRKAREKKADLFLSLHADSIRKPQTKGLSVYTLSDKASDREAEALAERENKADIIAGIDLNNEIPEVVGILIDLARRETMTYSGQFANSLIKELSREIETLPNTHRSAGFAVLKAPDIPSALLEMGYLSNREEEKLLRRPEYRRKLLKAVVDGINDYFEQKSLAF